MKTIIPSKTLLQGSRYVPSWLVPERTRYMTQKLQGPYGLAVPVVPIGTKSFDPHQELQEPV